MQLLFKYQELWNVVSDGIVRPADVVTTRKDLKTSNGKAFLTQHDDFIHTSIVVGGTGSSDKTFQIVGALYGWNSSSSHIKLWAENETFYVGDALVFIFEPPLSVW
ncbi:hypothetical protein QYF36_002541 [Acer negundo]|nr:hypothetical protein QYF36_002541 [Acer negundo]